MNFNSHATTLATHFLGWKGRISRSEWWLCWGVDAGLALVLYYVFKTDAAKAMDLGLLQTVTSGFLLWAAACANIKRFHDRNKHALWALIAFIPGIGTAWTIIELGFMRGTKGRNPYGEDPLQRPYGGLDESRTEILNKFKLAQAAKRVAKLGGPPQPQKSTLKPAPKHVLQQPLIQYGYKRPERTVTRG